MMIKVLIPLVMVRPLTSTVTDPNYGHVAKVTSGEGYGAGIQVAFAAFTGHGAGEFCRGL